MRPSCLKDCDLFQLQIKQMLVLPHNKCAWGATGRCEAASHGVVSAALPPPGALLMLILITPRFVGKAVPHPNYRGRGVFLHSDPRIIAARRIFGLCSACRQTCSAPQAHSFLDSCYKEPLCVLPAAAFVGRGTSCPLSGEIKAGSSGVGGKHRLCAARI